MRSRTALSNSKIAVLAPIPNASEMVATAKNPGLVRSSRPPYRRSCQSPNVFIASFLRLCQDAFGAKKLVSVYGRRNENFVRVVLAGLSLQSPAGRPPPFCLLAPDSLPHPHRSKGGALAL